MAKPGRGRVADDDLLTGFERTGPRQRELRAFFASLIAASLYVWDVTFDIGVRRSVDYVRIQQILVLSVVILLGVLVVRRQVWVHPWLLAAFLPPISLLLFRALTPQKHLSDPVRITDDALVIINVTVFPVIVWVTARLLAPEFFRLHSRHLKVAVVAIVIAIGIGGFVAGRYNYRFLTCHDFAATGDDPPPNCRHSGHP